MTNGKCSKMPFNDKTCTDYAHQKLSTYVLLLLLLFREKADIGRESRGGVQSGATRRGRGAGRGSSTPASEDGFDRFGKREFERHSGSDKTYVCLISVFFDSPLFYILHQNCHTSQLAFLFLGFAKMFNGCCWIQSLKARYGKVTRYLWKQANGLFSRLYYSC